MTNWITTAAAVVAVTAVLSAQQAQTPGRSRDDDENYLRPSKSLPPFKAGYFSGKWTFAWDVPDSIFGEGGEITGSETYTCTADGRSCVSDLEASGPGGPFSQQVRLTYNEADRAITRDEKDSRGFDTHNTGHVSAEQAFYQILYDGSPFPYKGKSVRFRTSATLSPTAYRLRVQISVDGGPYENFGNPWWRKVVVGR